MGYHVIESKHIGSDSMMLTLGCDGPIHEFSNPEIKRFAVKEAMDLGLMGPAIHVLGAPYPVNKAGEVTEDIQTGKEPVDHYRMDVTLRRRL